MEFANSLSGFFYNIIPGFIFLLINSLYFSGIKDRILISSNLPMEILQVTVVSIFLGFFFQSLTKITRDGILNQKVFRKIKLSDQNIFLDAKELLARIKSSKEEEDIKLIYLMHNYLVTQYKLLLPEFFSPRLALWSNMFFASIITIILLLITPYFNINPSPLTGYMFLDLILLAIFSWHSWEMTENYLYILFDSIIRSFVSTRRFGNRE